MIDKRTATLALSFLAFGSLPILTGAAAIESSGANHTPVLLELFTSEGCSSCPSADKLLQAFDRTQPVAGADLIVLSEHVDYWNHSGWSDPYSSAAFTNRQRDYAGKLELESVYTPQLIVDGSAELVGSNAVEARAAIAKALQRTKIPIALTNATRQGSQINAHLELAGQPENKGNPTIYLALADNQVHSDVTRGENAGRALSHVAVVRSMVSLGSLGSAGFNKDVHISVKSAGQNGLRIVAFVQDQNTLRILGVTQQKL